MTHDSQRYGHIQVNDAKQQSTKSAPLRAPVLDQPVTTPPQEIKTTNQTGTANKNSVEPTDWPMFALTAVYVLVSSISLYFLTKQTGTAAKAADAANNQINMMKSKERARLSVLPPQDVFFAHPHPSLIMSDPYLASAIGVFNEGATKAFKVQVSGCLTSVPASAETVPQARWYPLRCPEVIRDVLEDNPVEVHLAPFGVWLHFERDTIKTIENGTEVLHAIGQITYDDVFGDPHVTPFHYRWMTEKDVANSWPQDAYWDDQTDRSKKT